MNEQEREQSERWRRTCEKAEPVIDLIQSGKVERWKLVDAVQKAWLTFEPHRTAPKPWSGLLEQQMWFKPIREKLLATKKASNPK